jgi:hypothetical protein
MGKAIPKNVKVAAMRAYVADKKTLREVSLEFGVNSESLRRWLGDKVRPRGKHLKGRPSNNPSIRKSESVPVVERKPRVSKLSPTYSRANHRWTTEEDEILRDAVLSGMTVKETTELLGRTPVSIYCRKCQLIDEGFISDTTKFVLPSGIKRVRKPLKNVMSTPEVVADVLMMASDAKETDTKVIESIKPTSNIDLADLAKLVKEFGVNVTLNVTSEGMEVKMTN